MTRMGHSSTRAAPIHPHMAGERDRTIADRLGAMIRESNRLRRAGSPSGL